MSSLMEFSGTYEKAMLPKSKVKRIVLEMKIECFRENNCSKTEQIFKERSLLYKGFVCHINRNQL
jgi:hypothetical protein